MTWRLHPAVCAAAQTIYGATMSDEPTFAEIVITPEMIEAGVLALLEYDPDFSNEEGVVVEMFRAMRKAIPPQEPKYPLRTFDGKPLPKPLSEAQKAALLDLAEKRFARAIVSEDG